MSGMDPFSYFENFVESNFQDWQKNSSNLAKAFNVAVPAFHMADTYFRYFKRHDKDFSIRYQKLGRFHLELAKRTPLFRVIQGVANAYKHLYTDEAICEVASGGSTYVTYRDQTIEQDFRQENGNWIECIQIRLRNGTEIQFEMAILEVVEMWRKIINSDQQPAL